MYSFLVGFHREVCRLDGHRETYRRIGSLNGVKAGVLHDLLDKWSNLERTALQWHGPRFELRQVEELRHKAPETFNLSEHCLESVSICGLNPVYEVLQNCLQSAYRSPQFVRDVGHKITSHSIYFGELGGHPVERSRQLPNLVSRRRGDPAVVVPFCHGLSRRRHLTKRGSHSPRKELNHSESKSSGRNPSDGEGKTRSHADGDYRNGDKNRRQDDDAELDLYG
jgi:hypothetical protein